MTGLPTTGSMSQTLSQKNHFFTPLSRYRYLYLSPLIILNPPTYSSFNLHRRILVYSSSSRHSWFRRSASAPGRPPPESDPRTEDDSIANTGILARLSRFQDSVQIFFAVLFWMSLFFWSSAWDGRNGGRPNKRSPFKR